MKKPKKPKVFVGVWVSPAARDRFWAYCDRRGLKKSHVVEQALLAFLRGKR
jgi:hypothetical protein